MIRLAKSTASHSEWTELCCSLTAVAGSEGPKVWFLHWQDEVTGCSLPTHSGRAPEWKVKRLCPVSGLITVSVFTLSFAAWLVTSQHVVHNMAASNHNIRLLVPPHLKLKSNECECWDIRLLTSVVLHHQFHIHYSRFNLIYMSLDSDEN